jgi:hypothetical protein
MFVTEELARVIVPPCEAGGSGLAAKRAIAFQQQSGPRWPGADCRGRVIFRHAQYQSAQQTIIVYGKSSCNCTRWWKRNGQQ